MTERPARHLPRLDLATEGPSQAVREALRERAAGLAAFGYRSADAEFLAVAGLLGGYFVRRQYRAYVGCRAGGAETSMLKLAQSNGHAVPVVGRTLFRLRGASFYRAIRSEGSLAQREGAWAAIKKRLLVLDYFLESGSDGLWLLSESDKAGYFASLDVAADRFPASARGLGGRTRVFSDGFPIRVADGDSPLVSFSYVHLGSTDRGVLRHLECHEALLAALALKGFMCEWVMLADSPVQFLRLRTAWRRWRDRVARDCLEQEYFQLRLEIDKRNWGALSRESIERYASLCSQCRGHGVDGRYRQWLNRGSPARQPGEGFADACQYREVHLDSDYAIAERVVRER